MLKKEELIINNRINPLVSLIDKSSKELRALASMSGLSIDSRLRIKKPETEIEQEDEFAKMFQESRQ